MWRFLFNNCTSFTGATCPCRRPPNHCVVFAACPTAVTGAWGAVCRLGCDQRVCFPGGATSTSAGEHIAHSYSAPHTPPHPSAAAHNCTMKCVAVMGKHPAFKLKNADLTCASMGELSVYNIRRLFANRGSESMDLRHKFVGAPPPQRRVRNATSDDEPE